MYDALMTTLTIHLPTGACQLFHAHISHRVPLLSLLLVLNNKSLPLPFHDSDEPNLWIIFTLFSYNTSSQCSCDVSVWKMTSSVAAEFLVSIWYNQDNAAGYTLIFHGQNNGAFQYRHYIGTWRYSTAPIACTGIGVQCFVFYACLVY